MTSAPIFGHVELPEFDCAKPLFLVNFFGYVIYYLLDALRFPAILSRAAQQVTLQAFQIHARASP
jgi:hypothetical protein